MKKLLVGALASLCLTSAFAANPTFKSSIIPLTKINVGKLANASGLTVSIVISNFNPQLPAHPVHVTFGVAPNCDNTLNTPDGSGNVNGGSSGWITSTSYSGPVQVCLADPVNPNNPTWSQAIDPMALIQLPVVAPNAPFIVQVTQ